jgi:hypothetical protein
MCAINIPALKAANINTVVVHAVAVDENHSGCMTQLDDAGIYTIVSLGGTNYNSSIGYRPTTWDTSLYSRFTTLVDKFQKYNNVLGFSVSGGLEMRHPAALPFAKAAVRDMKTYIRQKNYRKVPLGVMGYDDQTSNLPRYLSCSQDNDTMSLASSTGLQSSGAEFYILTRRFASCNESTMRKLNDDYRTVSIPVIYSQMSCSDDVNAPKLGILDLSVFAGFSTYTWFNDDDDRGLIDFKAGKIKPRPTYSALLSQMATWTPPAPTKMAEYVPSPTEPPTCGSFTIHPAGALSSFWSTPVSVSNVLPPIPYNRLCACMMQSLVCVAPPDILSDNQSAMDKMDACKQNGTWCSGVSVDGGLGTYGAYSVCNATEQASWVLNQQTLSTKGSLRVDQACTVVGGIKKLAGTLSNECKALFQQAGPDGTGRITSTPKPEAMESPFNPNMSLALKIGLGFAIAIGLMILIVGILLLYHQRRRKAHDAAAAAAVAAAAAAAAAAVSPFLKEKDLESAFPKSELPDTSIETPRHQLDNTELREMDGSPVGSKGWAAGNDSAKELPTENDRAEAPGTDIPLEMGTSVERFELDTSLTGGNTFISELEGDTPMVSRAVTATSPMSTVTTANVVSTATTSSQESAADEKKGLAEKEAHDEKK